MSPLFPRLEAAAIDGRYHNIYHRQVELERLCKALTDNANEIKQAIATDYAHSQSEIAVEYHLTLSAVKRYYASLDPKKAHEEEYLVATGKDARENRVPAGIVYIDPSAYTLFYSTIVPLSAAIAAGNCVVLLLENNLRATSSILRRLLSGSLSADVLAIASSPVEDRDFTDRAVCVLQHGIDRNPTTNELTFSSTAPVIAMVDRTADIKTAASELVAARFSFRGHSPYAPDIVLVNEFRKQDFLQAVVSEYVRIGSNAIETPNSTKTPSTSDNTSRINAQLETLKASDPALRTILQDSHFALVDISSRSTVLHSKIQAPILAIHAVRSLDDAIDLVSSHQTPCLSAYHFANPATCKYLSQFIPAIASFANHIPRDLLVGPPAPLALGQPLNLTDRYPLDLFTTPRPVFVQPVPHAAMLERALSSRDNVVAQKLFGEAKAPLKAVKRNPGGGVGFFEMGFFLNAGLVLGSVLVVSATGSFWLWRRARRI